MREVLESMSWDHLAPVGAATLPAYARPDKNGLRILVALKHVGVVNGAFELSADGLGITPESLEYQMNEWDDAALEMALQIVEANGEGEVVVVSVGPEEAEQTLRKGLAKGANRAVRIETDRLDHPEPIAIARMIAGAAIAEQADMVFAGVQSGDMANGATGPAVAAILGFPCAVSVQRAELQQGGKLKIVRELEGGVLHTMEMSIPAVLCVQTSGTQPRYATMRMIKQARQKPLDVAALAADDVPSGSATLDHFELPIITKAIEIEGAPADVADFVAQLIREAG